MLAPWSTRSVLWRKSLGIFGEEILTPSGPNKNTERRNNSQPGLDWTGLDGVDNVNFYYLLWGVVC